ncbi:MAG: multidrug effflux MFS transporter [Alphaproteobacteria bacterium]
MAWTRPRADSLTIAALLTALAAYGPLAVDVYLPSLPSIVADYGTTEEKVQLTLSLFFVGFALGQLLHGPLSDRFGRRPVLIAGTATFILASIMAALASSVDMLIVARFLQALGAASGSVLSRTVVRDVYGPERSARVMAYMAAAMGLAPSLGPMIGGQIEEFLGWRWNFAFVAAAAGLCLLAIISLLKETNPKFNPEAVNFGPMLRIFARLAAEPAYLGHALTLAFNFGGYFAFISASAFVFIEFLGLTPGVYGVCFGAAVLGGLSGNLTSGRLVRRVGSPRLVLWGGIAGAASGLAMAGLAWGGSTGVWQILIPMAVYTFGMGLIMPNTIAMAIAPWPHNAGAASSLLGFIQMVLSAAAGILVVWASDGTQLAMVTAIAIGGVGALLSHVWLGRRGRRPATAQ